jgi:hypothetical protein
MTVTAITRHHRLRLVINGKPKLVPSRAFTISTRHGVDLLKRSISELKDINHSNDLAAVIHDG